MKFQNKTQWSNDLLIEDILPAEAKLSLPHTANCFDALELLKKSNLANALVKNMSGSYLGVTATQTLSGLEADKHQHPVENYLEKVTSICTPKCPAGEVATRLLDSQNPYVLVVDSSGRLISFLEPSDFKATPLL